MEECRNTITRIRNLLVVNYYLLTVAQLVYSLRVDNTCRFGQEHAFQKTTLAIIFHYNMYKGVNKYMILLKYFLRLIYTCSHHILKMIHNQRF